MLSDRSPPGSKEEDKVYTAGGDRRPAPIRAARDCRFQCQQNSETHAGSPSPSLRMRLVRRSRLAFRGCEITAPGESDLNTQWKLIWAIWVVKGKFDGGVIA